MATIDDILVHLGPWHLPVLAFCFFRGFPAAYYAMSLSFTAPSLPHWCARPPQLANWSVERWIQEAVPHTLESGKAAPSECEAYAFEVQDDGNVSIRNDTIVRCSSWEYDLGGHKNTLTNEFDLVCDRVWLRAASQSFYMAGIMIGNFVFAHMSDWYGRKRALIFMTPLPILATVVICFSTSFLMLNIGRFVASLGLGGILNTTYTLSLEVLSAPNRALGSFISTGGWTTGLLTFAGLAWLCRDWLLLQGVITVAALASIVNWIFIPESPRWLLAMGRYDEARKELQKAVRKNKVKGISVEAIVKEYKDKISLCAGHPGVLQPHLLEHPSGRPVPELRAGGRRRVSGQASGRCGRQLPAPEDVIHRALHLRLALFGGSHLRAATCLLGSDGHRSAFQDGHHSRALRQRGPDNRAIPDQATNNRNGLHHNHEPRGSHPGAFHQGTGRGVRGLGAQSGRHRSVCESDPGLCPAARDVRGATAGHVARDQAGQKDRQKEHSRSRSPANAGTRMKMRSSPRSKSTVIDY